MFVQIVSFRTDRIEDFVALEDEWIRDTEGRRTLVDGALYRDRGDSRRYWSINYFPSYEEAMVNSALPETTAFAEQAMARCDAPAEFVDLDLVTDLDARGTRAAELRSLMETNTDPTGVLAEDVVLDMYVPRWRVVNRGTDDVMRTLVDEAPGRSFDRYDVQTVDDGFVAEYAYRTTPTTDQPSTLSVGVVVATLAGGRISSLRVHCAGNWDAGLEREVETSVHAEASVLR